MNRRQFLCWSAAASALAFVDPVKIIAPVPQIWGDGVHDDAPGINALLRGEPCEIMNRKACRVEGGKVLLNAGTFMLAGPLIFDGSVRDSMITGCTFEGKNTCFHFTKDFKFDYT